jgi:type VI secretion system protein ImpK
MTPPFIDEVQALSGSLSERDERREASTSVMRRDARTGIRDLLRDTALVVTTLAQSGQVESVTALRERCKYLMSEFATALERRRLPVDVREDAMYAQCGLLDEAALRNLGAEAKAQWGANPLQVERFGKLDAGERVFERLTQRMLEAPPNADLLECYSAILGLGFMGRYASPTASAPARSLDTAASSQANVTPPNVTRTGENARAALIASLDAQLKQLRPETDSPFIADRTRRRFGGWFCRFTPWTLGALGCGAAVIVHVVWRYALDLQLAHLLSMNP